MNSLARCVPFRSRGTVHLHSNIRVYCKGIISLLYSNNPYIFIKALCTIVKLTPMFLILYIDLFCCDKHYFLNYQVAVTYPWQTNQHRVGNRIAFFLTVLKQSSKFQPLQMICVQSLYPEILKPLALLFSGGIFIYLAGRDVMIQLDKMCCDANCAIHIKSAFC